MVQTVLYFDQNMQKTWKNKTQIIRYQTSKKTDDNFVKGQYRSNRIQCTVIHRKLLTLTCGLQSLFKILIKDFLEQILYNKKKNRPRFTLSQLC